MLRTPPPPWRFREMVSPRPGSRMPCPPRLAPNVPNPFRRATRLRFDLPEAGQVTLEVFDLSGRKVRVLEDAWYAAGSHEVTWNADDTAGQPVAAGIYFIRMRAGAFIETR